MADISEHWTSFENIDRESEHAQRIGQLLSAANFSFLCSAAVELRCAIDVEVDRTETLAGSLTCSVDPTRFASGRYNVAVALRFSDSEQWIARIRLPAKSGDDDSEDEVERSMLSEIATVRLVGSKTTIPVPHIYGFNVAKTSPLGFRYLLMQALPGRHPDNGFARSIPRTAWDKVADQLADYYHQLSRLRFDRIGRISSGPEEETRVGSFDGMGPFATSLEYFYALRKDQSRAINVKHAGDEQWETAAWILEQALPSMVVEEHVHGPFPLCHLDLHHDNVLIDEDFNISGILDWSDAQTVPIERFVITPEFAYFPGLSAEKNEPILAFRDKFTSALRAREVAAREEDGGGSPASPLISDIFGTPLWEIVYRCTYSFHWRALSDSRLVLRQMFGSAAKWEDFLAYHADAPLHRGESNRGVN
ncbi:MAG: hypothetical protein M1832_005779 [Thelocarpon impressellum]|nr:MAG: hypothetical protein M1832_005779 [Thelocarpon impressellum]